MRFVDRHNGPDERQVGEMLAVLGLKDLSELVAQTVPSDILLKEPLALDKALSEHEYLGKLKNIARKKLPRRDGRLLILPELGHLLDRNQNLVHRKSGLLRAVICYYSLNTTD